MKYYLLHYIKKCTCNQGWTKKRNIVSIVLIVLFAVHILSKYLQSTCPPATMTIKYIENQIRTPNYVTLFMENKTIDNPIFNMNLSLGRWDNQRLYKMFDHVYVGNQYIDLSNRYNVCLATQSSIDRIDSFAELVEHWTGPVSLSIYVADEDELALIQGFIQYLDRCHNQIVSKSSLHILFSKNASPRYFTPPYTTMQLSCSLKPGAVLQSLLTRRNKNARNWKIRNPYPQNHLRNLARKNCQTHFNYLTDIDIIPSYGILEDLHYFLKHRHQESCKKCAYVIPTFELDHRVKYPKDKADLLRLYNKQLAQPFHHKVFIYNQYATNISRWKNPQNDERTHVSHEVTNFEFLYEPFYVSDDTVPPHDERFIGYGYTRNTQVYEMYIAGYQFRVLSPLFSCHWGLLTKRSRPPWRDVQNYRNHKLLNDFKREIFAKYNYNSRKFASKSSSSKSNTPSSTKNNRVVNKNLPG